MKRREEFVLESFEPLVVEILEMTVRIVLLALEDSSCVKQERKIGLFDLIWRKLM